MRFRPILAIATMIACTTLHARPVRKWTQQELFDEANFVAIVIADAPEPVPNTHEFVANAKHLDDYLQQHESKLTVLAVLKGNRESKTVTLVHFLKRRDVKSGMGNGPKYIWMGTNAVQHPGGRSEQKPKYLVYLKSRSDGKFDPVTGQLDPPDSIVRIIPFPERDPAIDNVPREPASETEHFRR